MMAMKQGAIYTIRAQLNRRVRVWVVLGRLGKSIVVAVKGIRRKKGTPGS